MKKPKKFSREYYSDYDIFRDTLDNVELVISRLVHAKTCPPSVYTSKGLVGLVSSIESNSFMTEKTHKEMVKTVKSIEQAIGHLTEVVDRAQLNADRKFFCKFKKK